MSPELIAVPAGDAARGKRTVACRAIPERPKGGRAEPQSDICQRDIDHIGTRESEGPYKLDRIVGSHGGFYDSVANPGVG